MLQRNKNSYSFETRILPEDFSLLHSRSNKYALALDDMNFYSKKRSMKEEMQCVTSYFSEFKPSQIATPFQGASLLISQDKSRFYFCSKEGRIATALIEKKEILQDIDLKEGPIRTIALYQNDKYLFSGGHSGAIKKFLLEDMSEVNTLIGHTSEIEAIVISTDEETLYSIGENGVVFKWDLTGSPITPVQLYSHSGLGCGLDLSTDNLYLASCGGDHCVSIFNTLSATVIENIQEKEFGVIWCLKITEKNKFIAFGDDHGKVYIYKFETWEKIFEFQGHEDKVRCMVGFLSERFIITGGSDHKIVIWDIEECRERLVLKGHKGGVKSLMVSQNNSVLYSMSEDSTIRTWKIPNFNHYFSLKMQVWREAILDIQTSIQQNSSIFIITSNELLVYDQLHHTETFLESFHDITIVCYNFSTKSDILCLISTAKEIVKQKSVKPKLILSQYEILIYDFYEKKYSRRLGIESYGVYSVLISPDEKFLLLGEIHHCRIFYLESFEIYHVFRSHKHEIVSLAISPNCSTLYSGDNCGIIKSFDFFGKYEIKTLNSHESKIAKMYVTTDSEYLVSMHADCVMDFWASSKMIKISSISLEKVLDFVLLKDSTKMLVFYKRCVKCFIVPSLTVMFCMSFDRDSWNFTLSSNELEILVYRQDKIAVYASPLFSQEIRAYGDLANLNYFHEQLGKLISGKFEKHDSLLNDWIIQPFNVNIMHLYAHLDKHKFLRQGFNENIGFIPSRGGYTPLDICLISRSEKCLDILYIEIKKAMKNNPLFLSVLENSLVRLNKCPYTNVYKFYKFAFLKSIDTRLPKFCQSIKKLPVVLMTSTALAHKSSFMDRFEYSNDGTAITFRQTYFRLDMIPGSRSSIKFVNSILESENKLIFTSEFIELLLNEKWKKVRIALYVQVLVYIGYLFSLSFYAINKDSSLISCFILSNVLIAYEIWQFICGGMDYFNDLWNYTDMIRSVLMTILFFQSTFSLFPEENLLAAVLGFSWFRGLSYFRLIKNTRYYVNLVYMVALDIFPFLTILFYSTIAFSIIFRVLMSNDNSEFFYVTSSWEINVGGFDTSNYGKAMYLAFFIHTLANPIIMLNLLISIMSNTFKKVNSQSVIADSKELASMILEGEWLFFWNRIKKEKQYMHMCSVSKSNTRIDLHNYKKLKDQISSMEAVQEEMREDIKLLLSRIH